MTLQDNCLRMCLGQSTHISSETRSVSLERCEQPFQSHISCTFLGTYFPFRLKNAEEDMLPKVFLSWLIDKEGEERFINQSYPHPTIFLSAHASSGGLNMTEIIVLPGWSFSQPGVAYETTPGPGTDARKLSCPRKLWRGFVQVNKHTTPGLFPQLHTYFSPPISTPLSKPFESSYSWQSLLKESAVVNFTIYSCNIN